MIMNSSLTLTFLQEKIDQMPTRSNVIVEKYALMQNHQAFIGISVM
jgi:hypothetical protein